MLFFNMEKEWGQHVCGFKDKDKLKLRENVAEGSDWCSLKTQITSYQPAPTNGMGTKEHFDLQDIPGL